MRAIGSSLLAASRTLSSDRGWLTFLEIARVQPPGDFFRLVKDNRHHLADSKTWQAAAFSLELPGESLEGATAEVSIAIPNVSRVPIAYAALGEFLGAPVRVWLAHEAHLGAFDPALLWSFVGLRWRSHEKTFTLDVGHPPALARVPGPRFERRQGQFPQLLPSGRPRL